MDRISHKNIFFLLFFALVIIILTASTTYFVLQSRQTRLTSLQPTVTPTQPVQSITSIPSPIPTTDETAGWKTYQNERYNFRFNYLIDWTMNDTFDTRIKESPIVELKSQDRNFTNGKAADMFVTTTQKEINLQMLKEIGISNNKITKSYKYISGDLYETEGTGIGGSGYRLDFIFIKNKKTFWIYLSTELKNKSTYKEVFNQILSTFRFLDQ